MAPPRLSPGPGRMKVSGPSSPAAVEMATARAGEGPVYLSFDIDALDPAHAPGTGTPVPGGLASWQALEFVRGLGALDLVGMDVVEVSPPYDTSDITALMGTRVIVDVLGALVASGKLGAHKQHIDKPKTFPHGEFEGKRWSNAT